MNLHFLIDEIVNSKVTEKQKIRFVIVTDKDYQTLLSHDTHTGDTLDIKLSLLPHYYDFFLPLAGFEKERTQEENPVDRAAAYNLGQLYSQILKDNPELNNSEQRTREELSEFICRLIFCFFAEDSELFATDQFTKNIINHTKTDGVDTGDYIAQVFARLGEKEPSPEYSQSLKDFPYVAGKMFTKQLQVPRFTRKTREILRELGHLDWKSINPDIFGSMIQAVGHDEDELSADGIQYTSPKNIRKITEPLILAPLKKQLREAGSDPTKLRALLHRMARIRVFDPACGSGNFLIVAYKDLRRLELEILSRLLSAGITEIPPESSIELSSFYGLEIEYFPARLASLSLQLAQHQTNREMASTLGFPLSSLLGEGQIKCANALRCNWLEFFHVSDGELYLIGNPPYKGRIGRTARQKEDLAILSQDHEIKGLQGLDYVCAWFIKAAHYAWSAHKNTHQPGSIVNFAFVASSSIIQGSQALKLWPMLYRYGVRISFAYQAFKFSNQAIGGAEVSCVVIAMQIMQVKPSNKKTLFRQVQGAWRSHQAPYINRYLRAAPEINIQKQKKPGDSRPVMTSGSRLLCGGSLILSEQEKTELISSYPASSSYVLPLKSAEDYLYHNSRYVLRISDDQLDQAREIPEISSRLDKVSEYRSSSTSKGTRRLKDQPHLYGVDCYQDRLSFVLPRTSSHRRKHLPIGYLPCGVVALNSLLQVFVPSSFVASVTSVVTSVVTPSPPLPRDSPSPLR
ncbi:MAG: N-6 DNA methylase [Proteobacteria bacterium]|nr:N-6 DNA methylase [Pseudomonadota bacterium]